MPTAWLITATARRAKCRCCVIITVGRGAVTPASSRLRVHLRAGLRRRRARTQTGGFRPSSTVYRGTSPAVGGRCRYDMVRAWRRSPPPPSTVVRPGGKRIHVGYYSAECDAALAYDETARRLRGVGTKTNFGADGECLVVGAAAAADDVSEGDTGSAPRDRTASWPTDTAEGGVAEPAHATTEACTAVGSAPGASPGKPRAPSRKRPRPPTSRGTGGASSGGSSVRSAASDDGLSASSSAALTGVSCEAQCTAATVAFFKRERTGGAGAGRASIMRPRRVDQPILA